VGVKVRVIRYTLDGDRIVAAAAKRSLSRRDLDVQLEKMSDEEVSVWIEETFKRQHFSPWEHSVYTWTVEGCSRVCSHQLVRHRIASFTQLSFRYAKLGFDTKCINPALYRNKCVRLDPGVGSELEACQEKGYVHVKSGGSEAIIRLLDNSALIEKVSPSGDKVEDALVESWLIDMFDSDISSGFEGQQVPLDRVYRRYCRMIDFVMPPSIKSKRSLSAIFIKETSRLFQVYRNLISRGVPPEDARFIIPMGVQTKLVVTMNARELIQSFLPLRMCTKAQWEIRMVAWLLWRELYRIHPRLFKYAGPRCVFYENAVRRSPITLEDLINGANLVIERCPENIDRKDIPRCVRSNILLLEKNGYTIGNEQ
jgi:thymidylate synthase (FAD)